MLAWDNIPRAVRAAHADGTPLPAGVLYQLAVAFPSWAGVIMLVYSVSLRLLGLLPIAHGE